MNGQKKGFDSIQIYLFTPLIYFWFFIYLLTYTTESRPTHSLPQKTNPLTCNPTCNPTQQEISSQKQRKEKNKSLPCFDPCALFFPHLFPNVWAHTHKHKPSNHHEILYMQFCTLHTRAHTRKHKPSNRREDLYT